MESLVFMEARKSISLEQAMREHLSPSLSNPEREIASSSEQLDIPESVVTKREKAPIIPDSPIKDIEKRLLALMVPPKTSFSKTIWNLAVHIESSRIELDRLTNTQEFFLAPDRKDKIGIRERSVLEKWLLNALSKLLLPLLHFALSSERRARLQDYHQEYAQLLQTNNSLNNSVTKNFLDKPNATD